MPGIVSQPTFQQGLTTGSPNLIDLGTKTARPGGVENVLEYNGSFLNIRDWIDTYMVLSIDGLADGDIRDAREVNPGRHGETPFNALYGGRTITINGRVRAHTLNKLRDMQMGLKQIFGDINRELPLYFRTSDSARDVFINCKKSAPILWAETQKDYNFHRDFQVTLRASYPFFQSYLETQTSFAPASGTLTLNNTVKNLGNTEAETKFRVMGPLLSSVNGGPALKMNRVYTDSSGFQVSKPFILNAPAGTTTAVSTGRYIEIDSKLRTVKEYMADGTYVADKYDQWDITSEWIDLIAGNNIIEMTKYATSAVAVQMYHRGTFL